MRVAEAQSLLGVEADTTWAEVRAAYRARIRASHPDRNANSDSADAVRIIDAYRVLQQNRSAASTPPFDPGRAAAPVTAEREVEGWHRSTTEPIVMERIGADTIAFSAPAEETLTRLLEACHEIGEVTYLDRSVPIAEVLCRFEGEPSTSLVMTLQGRAHTTEVFFTAESIEARSGPATDAVVDVMEDALARLGQGP